MTFLRTGVTALFAGAFLALAACAQESPRMTAPNGNANSIQPETTLSITATGKVTAEPDLATITMGVTTEAKTAAAALSQNATQMNGLFRVLRGAGIAERDIQTSNFSLSPRYSYPERSSPRLDGFTASNNVAVRVRKLDTLGTVLDAVVREGGNTFSGLTFSVDDDTALRDQAREKAMTEALARAELYATAAGYKVARIVTINEGGEYQPQTIQSSRMMAMDSAESSPIAGGELTYTSTVNVTFELTK